MAKNTPPTSEVRVEYMPLLALRGTKGNPKAHDLPKIKASMKRFGFTSPMLMNEATGRIVAGHGRIETLILLRFEGADPPERVREIDGEWHVPVLRGVSFRDESEAKAYLLGDNKIGELGGWNDSALAEMLQEITVDSTGADLLEPFLGTGFEAEDLAKLIAAGSESPPEAAEGTGDAGKFMVVVECPTEAEQAKLLERLNGEGFKVRALVS